MRATPRWALLAVLLTGCGSSAPPLPPTARLSRPAYAPVVQAVPDPGLASPEAEATAKAARWAEQLIQPDPSVRQQACQALNNLGKAGYPHLIKAARSDVYELSVLALETLQPPALHEHSKEMVPFLLERLQDSDPTMRRLAAERLAWFDRLIGTDEIYPGPQPQERLKALLKAGHNDRDSAVRSVALTSAGMVHQAIQGRISQLDARTLANPDAVPMPGNVRPKRELKR